MKFAFSSVIIDKVKKYSIFLIYWKFNYEYKSLLIQL